MALEYLTLLALIPSRIQHYGAAETLRANIDETLTAAIITEQGGKENHRERDQDCCSFCSQFV